MRIATTKWTPPRLGTRSGDLSSVFRHPSSVIRHPKQTPNAQRNTRFRRKALSVEQVPMDEDI
jgi:hypothetical protein